jgi:hypothetical protein
MKNIEKELTDLSATILETLNKIEPDIINYLKDSVQRPAIDFYLLKIISYSIKANQMISPRETIGEIHGIPREFTDLNTKPGFTIKNVDQSSEWDFTPWLKEKLNRLETAAQLLIEEWLKELNDIKLRPDAPMTPAEFIRSGISMNFNEVHRMATTIFEELCNNKLQIIQHD